MINLTTDEALQEINFHKRTKISLNCYLALGKALSVYRTEYPSNKNFGKVLKQENSKLAELPPAFRSDCLWLYEFPTDATYPAIIKYLGVTGLEELSSSHPSVIRRRCRSAQRSINAQTKGDQN